MKKVMLTSLFAVIVIAVSIVSCKDKDSTPQPDPTPTSANQFTDSRDNKTYKTVTIGTQTWMAENLNYQGTLSAGNVYCYNDVPDSCVKYGGWYDWDAANVACPNGWRLPSDSDWQKLESQLGMSDLDTSATSYRGTDQGTQLKVGGSSGFNGKLVGGSNSLGSTDFSVSGVFWTSTQAASNTKAYYRMLNSSETKIFRSTYLKNGGFCVRCLKN